MERNKQPLRDHNSSFKLAITIMIEKLVADTKRIDVLLILSGR
jgi:hypothetical protein